MNQKYKSFILFFFFFFFNDTATTEIYTLSLHDALPILPVSIALFWAAASCSIVMPFRSRSAMYTGMTFLLREGPASAGHPRGCPRAVQNPQGGRLAGGTRGVKPWSVSASRCGAKSAT